MSAISAKLRRSLSRWWGRHGYKIGRDVAINVAANLIAASLVWLVLVINGYTRGYPLITYWACVLLILAVAIGGYMKEDDLPTENFGGWYNRMPEVGKYPNLPEPLWKPYGRAESPTLSSGSSA